MSPQAVPGPAQHLHAVTKGENRVLITQQHFPREAPHPPSRRAFDLSGVVSPLRPRRQVPRPEGPSAA